MTIADAVRRLCSLEVISLVGAEHIRDVANSKSRFSSTCDIDAKGERYCTLPAIWNSLDTGLPLRDDDDARDVNAKARQNVIEKCHNIIRDLMPMMIMMMMWFICDASNEFHTGRVRIIQEGHKMNHCYIIPNPSVQLLSTIHTEKTPNKN